MTGFSLRGVGDLDHHFETQSGRLGLEAVPPGWWRHRLKRPKHNREEETTKRIVQNAAAIFP